MDNLKRPVLKVFFYKSENEREPARDWILNLTTEDKKIIGQDIKTAQFGWPLGMPLIRKIETNLWEVRSKIKDGIARVFFTVDDNTMILLHGFVKKSQTTPLSELETAKTRRRRYHAK